jgi:proteic killer suppression protein
VIDKVSSHSAASRRAQLNRQAALVARRATRYEGAVIQSFRQKGLRRFFESGGAAWIQPKHTKRLRMLLVALDTAQTIDDMGVPGFNLHPLKGQDKGRWSIWVNGNWRVTFEFRDGHAYVLDYEDYH